MTIEGVGRSGIGALGALGLVTASAYCCPTQPFVVPVGTGSAVTGLGTLAAGSQRRDDFTIGRKRLSRQVFDIQHAPGQWARIAHCSSLPSISGHIVP